MLEGKKDPYWHWLNLTNAGQWTYTWSFLCWRVRKTPIDIDSTWSMQEKRDPSGHIIGLVYVGGWERPLLTLTQPDQCRKRETPADIYLVLFMLEGEKDPYWHWLNLSNAGKERPQLKLIIPGLVPAVGKGKPPLTLIQPTQSHLII